MYSRRRRLRLPNPEVRDVSAWFEESCRVLGSGSGILWVALISRWVIARTERLGGYVRLDRPMEHSPHSLFSFFCLVFLEFPVTCLFGRTFVLIRKVFYFPSANSNPDSSSNRFRLLFLFSFLNAPIGNAGFSAKSTAREDLQNV